MQLSAKRAVPKPTSLGIMPGSRFGIRRLRPPRWLRRLVVALLLLLAAFVLFAYWQLRASLPTLAGTQKRDVLAEVRIERDALGTATIHAGSRADAYFAQGFVHAQERFFQMDLARRSAAGELSELFGVGTLERDKAHRVHQLRRRLLQYLPSLPPVHQQLLQRYTDGVNAGLQALGARPFEYLLLRAETRPWQPVDSLLVGASMMFSLQDHRNQLERNADLARRALDPTVYQYLFYRGSAAHDAPLLPGDMLDPPIPLASAVDLRALPDTAFAPVANAPNYDPEAVRGSNNWAVDGSLTQYAGPALLANDMHLGLGVPSVWFRQQLNYPHPDAADQTLQVTGVSLPGAPGTVVGSNGRVAWGITNSYGDFADFVRLEQVDAAQQSFQLGAAREPITHSETVIQVKGEAAVALTLKDTRLGPIVAQDADGMPLALAWVAHRAGGVDTRLVDIELSQSTDAVLKLVQQAGMPHSNIVAADNQGYIGWALGGRIPMRAMAQGDVDQSAHQTPIGSSQLSGDIWNGWRSDAPSVYSSANNRVYTANSRVVGQRDLATVGDGGYALGQRALRIRQRLEAQSQFDEADMLALQLDDSAPMLERWWQRINTIVDRSPDLADRAKLQEVLSDWNRQANIHSRAYRLVRNFRLRLLNEVSSGLAAPIRVRFPDYKASFPSQAEAIVWPLLESRPMHLLPKPHASWDALERATLDATIAGLRQAGDIEARSWGEYNTAKIQHPLSRAIPVLGIFLDMPKDPLPGDTGHVVRAQGPSFGASQRLVVAPSQEARGIFHMPGGQSGHPLSPFYGSGHADWVQGNPSALLPGATVHTLILQPK